MHSQLFGYFLDSLTQLVSQIEEAVADATDAHALSAVSLAVVGATADTAYQAVPRMNPRTVRRVLAGAEDSVRMCLYSNDFEQQQVHKDSSENAVVDDIREKAERVKVSPGIAEAAVTRYGNSPERVTTVLDDLGKLLEAGGKVWNPTGLFTRLMRSGGAVKLPAAVLKAEAEKRQQQQQKPKPEPAVGMLVKLYGEVCRIVGLTRQFAEVETRDGLVNVSKDHLRFA